ncbi:MAG: thioredoxin [Candidatus Nanoarchaeia archaeon]
MASDKVPELTNGEFDGFIKNGSVLIDFFAEWCMPCLMMAPIMEELSDKFKGKVKFGKINVDENNKLAQKFDVMSIPNFILFKNGKASERFVGAMNLEDFEQKLKKSI